VSVVTVSDEQSPKVALPAREKLFIGVLLVLEVPAFVIFFPAAAVLFLTGILAPLGMMCFVAGTLPLSLAMKRRAAWNNRVSSTLA